MALFTLSISEQRDDKIPQLTTEESLVQFECDRDVVGVWVIEKNIIWRKMKPKLGSC